MIANKQHCYFCQVDFGCILNDTEVTRSVLVTNNSPMDVKYHWSFVDSELRIEKIVILNGTLVIHNLNFGIYTCLVYYVSNVLS